jgi:hypothetical protein
MTRTITKLAVYRRPRDQSYPGAATTTKLPRAAHLFPDPDRIFVSFSDDYASGGRNYYIPIRSMDFAEIAKAMMRANAEEAIKALGTALQAGIPEQVKEDI